MRVHQYRAWVPEEKKMYYKVRTGCNYPSYWHSFDDPEHGHMGFWQGLPHGTIVMEYTDVFDSNGVEICDGDLLQISDRPAPQKVYYANGTYGTEEFALHELLASTDRTMIVVGNVFEPKGE